MQEAVIQWWGAIFGLIIAIFLILKKVNAVYALFLGSIIGGVIGGATLTQTVDFIIQGTSSIMGAVVRVLAAGVLAGILIESGAAEKIAETIVEKLGENKAILSIALATLVITAVGVFVTVAIIIVAPIGLSVAKRTGISKMSLLLAMTGGGKAGNVISPNPNTISLAKGFNSDLANVMIAGFIPSIVGLIITCLIASLIVNKGAKVRAIDLIRGSCINYDKPSFFQAMVAPITAIILLGINPVGSMLKIQLLSNFKIDAMVILPFSGVIGLIAMGKIKNIISYTSSGLNKMSGTAILLIGAGAIAGIISKSNLSMVVVGLVNSAGISGIFLAPLAGILMGAATASTSTAAVLAVSTFGEPILNMGVASLNAAVMVHTGIVVLDHLPHGNFFLVSTQSAKMSIGEGMKLIPYQCLVGGSMCVAGILIYGFLM